MPRRQFEQWGIAFGTRTASQGYDWHVLSHSGHSEPVQVLFERSEGDSGTSSRGGLGEARRALNAFRVLAKELAPLDRKAAGVVDGLANPERFDEIHGPPRPSLEHARLAGSRIVHFANRYGALEGNHRPMTLQEWISEARDFLDLEIIAKAIASGDFRAFTPRVQEGRNRFGEEVIIYRRPHGDWWEIAREGRSLEESGPNSRARYDWIQIARERPARAAWLLFSRQINGKLDGGLSLAVPSVLATQLEAWVEPRALGPMLYTRLWLDVMAGFGAQLDRRTTCLHCGEALPSNRTKRLKYCDDRCRKAFNRGKPKAIQETRRPLP